MEKNPINSKTIQGVAAQLVALLALLAPALGIPWPEGIGDEIVQAVAGVLGIIGTIWAIIGRFKAKDPIKVSAPIKKPKDTTLAFCLMIVTAFALAGCGGGFGAPKIDAKTPTERLAAIEVEFTSAVATLNDLADQGILKGKALDDAQTAVKTISSLLDQAGLAIDNGQYGDFESYVAAANAALLQLLQTVEENQNAHSGIDQGGARRDAALAYQLYFYETPGPGLSGSGGSDGRGGSGRSALWQGGSRSLRLEAA